jgi:hypothetical protein
VSRTALASRPAAAAAGRVFALGALLAGLGVASAAVAITRMLVSWRVTSGDPSHHIGLLGAQLSYPVANAGAIVVAALAGLGVLTGCATGWAIGA